MRPIVIEHVFDYNGFGAALQGRKNFLVLLSLITHDPEAVKALVLQMREALSN